jgi:phosphotransferase system  glucose/maltose/N-acetylglucosamine-specific IIC component
MHLLSFTKRLLREFFRVFAVQIHDSLHFIPMAPMKYILREEEKTMRLSIRATAFAVGILSGIAVLLTGLANSIWPGYGKAFLQLLASIYPGYKASGSIGDLITGVLYALVDGGLCGLVFAWIYNRFLGDQPAVPGWAKREAGVRYPPIEPKA